MGNSTFDLIYEQVKRIPKGKVATYGQIAALAGNPRWPRVVGFALHVNPYPDVIPCFRVVNRHGECSGSFAFGGAGVQRKLLEDDGVVFGPEDRVDLYKCLWKPEEDIK